MGAGFDAKIFACAALLSAVSLSVSASAAPMLSASVATSVGSTENLTADGAFQWAIWDAITPSYSGGAPTNTNSTATGHSVISSMSSTSGGATRGISGATNNTPVGFTYTDGNSPASQTNAQIGAVLDTNTGTAGDGVRFTVTGNPNVAEVVKVFTTGFNGPGTLTASLNGATTYVNSNTTYGGATGPRTPETIYTLTFQPADLIGSDGLLTVSYTNATTASNENMDIQAVTVATVPEPATGSVLLLATVGLLSRRRVVRRRK